MQRPQSEQSDVQEVQRDWTARRGQILVMFAAGIFLLVGMVALAIDAGFLMAERRQVQSGADAGALAAAKAKLDYLYESDSDAIQTSTGKQYAANNADTSQDNVEVDPDPGMDGFDDVYIEDTYNRYVEVTVSKDVQSFFLGALYDGDWNTSATAIAGIEPVLRPYALLALGCGPGSNGGIHIAGSGTVDVNEGSIMSNCGITTSGAAGSSIVTAEGTIDAFGPIEDGPNWSAGEGINENRPRSEDPVLAAGIDPPSKTDAQSVQTVTAQDELHDAVEGSITHGSNGVRCDGTCQMGPGYYGGDLQLEVRGTLELQPGIYYFDGDFSLAGQNSGTLITGTDVLLYFDGDSKFEPKNSDIVLSAPGAEAGSCDANLDAIVLWIANGTSFLMQSAEANFQLDGVIYAPESHVRLYGGPYSSGMQVIVKSLELAGGNSFDILYLDCLEGETPHIFLVK